MNRFHKQILTYISDTEESDGKITASCCYPEDFIGFAGHFPGNPILPGICFIQTVLLLASPNDDYSLNKIVQAKFFNTLTCNQTCIFKLTSVEKKDGVRLVKANISRDGEKIAKIDILISEKK